MRYREDLAQIQPLGLQASKLEELFYHREKRKVRKDGTVQWEGQHYEVPHLYVQQTVTLVIDPHLQKALYLESDEGEKIAEVTRLDKIANLHRKRQRPELSGEAEAPRLMDAVEYAYQEFQQSLQLSDPKPKSN